MSGDLSVEGVRWNRKLIRGGDAWAVVRGEEVVRCVWGAWPPESRVFGRVAATSALLSGEGQVKRSASKE